MQRTLIFCALILGSCVATPSHPEEALLNSRHAAFVETPVGTGSGFPITATAYLTAWHVVEGWDAEFVMVDGNQVLEVIRVGDLDACVLVTAPHGREPWPLADRAPRPGERVYKSGYGQGLHWWTEGIATEDRERVAIDIFPGDSGGPLFSEDGEVVAIVVAVGTSRMGAILHHCWVVPMDDILAQMPPGVLDAPEPGASAPPAPLPVEETPWERFQRRRKELGV